MKRLAIVSAVLALSLAALACGEGSDGVAATPTAEAGEHERATTPTAQADTAGSEEQEAEAAPTPTVEAGEQERATTPTAQAEEATGQEADATPTETADTMEDDAEQGEPADAMERTAGQYEGITFNVSEGSEATFTVEEQLANLPLPNDAVLRTSALTGIVNFDGTESLVIIELRTLSSDSQYRDGYVRNRMFSTHPVAKVTVPSTLPLPEGFAAGNEVTTQVEATVNLLGSDFPLVFDIEARDDGDSVFVLGRSTFTWDQFGITKPTARSVVSIEDDVRVEVLLALEPVPAP